MSIKVIAMHFRSVESWSSACLVYHSNNAGKTAKTKEEALESLTEHLYQKYCFEYDVHRNPCCDGCVTKFCPTCGDQLVKQSFDVEHFEDWLVDLGRSTCDSYGYGEDIPNPYGWTVGFDFASAKTCLLIEEDAEEVISATLYKIHPELKEK